MDNRHLKKLIQIYKATDPKHSKARTRIENYVGQHGTDGQRTHFLDEITSPKK